MPIVYGSIVDHETRFITQLDIIAIKSKCCQNIIRAINAIMSMSFMKLNAGLNTNLILQGNVWRVGMK